ncbi:hypothetical protein [Pandoraea sputorum]|uniref:hypothetical protein n=1 Tax=Pandoraea sputorum TaxID=93222 RepID=UPI0012403730|nr:hypothetical protein [Pandoraea sputorum]VVE78162.1 hypothetical protein PSP31120_01538 [Pandoraea sputorum]
MSLYKILRQVPIFGTLLSIVNAYAYRGDLSAGKKFAGFPAYVAALWRPILVSLLLTGAVLHQWVATLWFRCEPLMSQLKNFSASPGSLSLSVIPSLLGFGIGVYALTFAIPERLVRDMDELLTKAIEMGRRKHGSVLVLNADLGYPLVVLTVALGVGVFQQSSPDVRSLVAICWFTFWYSVISMIEIIGVLFQLGDIAILEKRSSTKTSSPQDSGDDEKSE